MSTWRAQSAIGLGLLLTAGCMEFQRSVVPQGADNGRADLGPVVVDDDEGIPGLPEDLEEVETESGLRMIDVEQGLGAPAADGDEVDVHYTGWLEDGTKFDSSLERGEPLTVVIGAGSVIDGWEEGLIGLRTGGRRRLIIPPELAYGEEGYGDLIAADATLIFDVEIVNLRPLNWGVEPDDADTDGVGTDGAGTDDAADTPDDASTDGAVPDDAATDGVDDVRTDGLTDVGTDGASTDGVGTDGADTDGADDAGTDGIEEEGIPELPAGVEQVTTESGLTIIDIELGEGNPAVEGDTVDVHYTGWLEDGTKFDSSVDRGTPFTLTLGTGSVIAGWEEGLLGLQEGGRRRLIIPPELGYGESGTGSIPPNATLIFDVEMVTLNP